MKKLITGYDHNYYIDSEWYFYTKKWLKVSWSYAGWGYKQITMRLYWKYVKRYIHRLVALYFIPNPHGKKEVNHIDLNKANNSIDNLEWCTKVENEDHKRRSIHSNNYSKIQNAINDVGSKVQRAKKYWVSDMTILRWERKYKSF